MKFLKIFKMGILRRMEMHFRANFPKQDVQNTFYVFQKEFSGTSFFCNAFSLFSSSSVTLSFSSSSSAGAMMAVAAGNYDAVNVDILVFFF